MRLPLAALAVAALSLSLVAPAAASSEFDATIDCGTGPIEVTSTPSLSAPLTDVASDQKYKPVAWDVKVGDREISVTKRTGSKKQLIECSYEDAAAVGTVTVTPVKKS